MKKKNKINKNKYILWTNDKEILTLVKILPSRSCRHDQTIEMFVPELSEVWMYQEIYEFVSFYTVKCPQISDIYLFDNDVAQCINECRRASSRPSRSATQKRAYNSTHIFSNPGLFVLHGIPGLFVEIEYIYYIILYYKLFWKYSFRTKIIRSSLIVTYKI